MIWILLAVVVAVGAAAGAVHPRRRADAAEARQETQRAMAEAAVRSWLVK